jgi:hypothetical protein
VTGLLVEDLQMAGLLDDTAEPHLTSKGREWLRTLEDFGTQEAADAGGEWCADLVLSTNGLSR